MTASHDLSIIDHLLKNSPSPPESISDFKSWKQTWLKLVPHWETPIDRALAGGLAADRPAWAFASGYQAAIQNLTSRFNLDTANELAAVCITEKGGGHPAMIKSHLEPIPGRQGHWQLDGEKTFISCAAHVDTLWVVASTGKIPDGETLADKALAGKNQLRMAAVTAGGPGVSISPMPPLNLVPEIPHAQACFDSVVLQEKAILPGDGYLLGVKPFRTLEDLHVSAAFLAWLFGIGRQSNWPARILETILSLVVSSRSLALAPPSAPHVHLALGGLLEQKNHLLKEIETLWDDVDPATRQRWERDKKVMNIAQSARNTRLATAWRTYGIIWANES
jgi:acyl-CoA dehydrogenase